MPQIEDHTNFSYQPTGGNLWQKRLTRQRHTRQVDIWHWRYGRELDALTDLELDHAMSGGPPDVGVGVGVDGHDCE